MATNILFLWSSKRRCNVPTTVQTFRHIASPASRLGGRSPLKCPSPVSGGLLKKSSSKGSVPRLDSIRLALQRYQELHGDILPKKDFVVPHKTDIWPEALWGLKLGEFVLRTRYGVINSQIGGEFERMGFNLNPEPTRDEPTREIPLYGTVVEALLQYKHLHLNLLVPRKFVVPIESDAWPECVWGLHLGLIVSRIRSGEFYRLSRVELERIGLDYRPRSEVMYQTVKLGLLRYKELHGDMSVPGDFEVPLESDVWPASLLGFKLGIAVGHIRAGHSYVSRRKDLQSIGFDHRPRSEKLYQKVILALLRYKELHGDMSVPAKFRVPVESNIWPESLRGFRLGNAAMTIRAGSSHSSRRKELESIGFDYTPRSLVHYQTVKLALQQYEELHGDMLVPIGFIVPDSNLWPKSLVDFRLGQAVNRLRAGKSFVTKRKDLESIGFDYSPTFDNYYQTVKQALLRYKELHGDMAMTNNYRVPVESDLWPESLLGFRLGKAASHIRAGDCYVSRRKELESIGFDYTPRSEHMFQTVKLVLQRYKELHGDMLVPAAFKVPNGNDWPKSMEGYALGKTVYDIRRGLRYASRRDELESTGFDYITKILQPRLSRKCKM